MSFKKNGTQNKSKRAAGSIVLYVAAIIVAIIGVVYLVSNLEQFQKTVAQYVAQGYPAADVASQLMPGIYEPIAVYGGIAFLLFGAGMINQKISKCLKMLGDLRTESAELDSDNLDEEVPNAGGLAQDSVKSDELESSDVEVTKIES